MMALLSEKRDGSLFDLALQYWKQPIENMFAVQAPKLWSPEPGTSSEAVRVRRFTRSGGVEARLCGSNAFGFVATNALVVIDGKLPESYHRTLFFWASELTAIRSRPDRVQCERLVANMLEQTCFRRITLCQLHCRFSRGN